MFWFDFCFPKTAEAVNSKMTGWRFSELIGYEKRSLTQNNCAVLITKHQSPNTCQHFLLFLLVIFFIDLLSSTIEKIAHRVALEATARKVFEIKKFADTLLFLSIRNSSYLHTLLILWNVSRSFWSSRLLTTSAAFGKQKSKTNMILSNSTFYNLSTDI